MEGNVASFEWVIREDFPYGDIEDTVRRFVVGEDLVVVVVPEESGRTSFLVQNPSSPQQEYKPHFAVRDGCVVATWFPS